MLAVDTNVVVRFLVNDDDAQHRRALALFRDHTVWVAKTVLLESEWVLRAAFGFQPAEIGGAFRNLLGLRSVRWEDLPAIVGAVDALSMGLDFADALHMTSAQSAGADQGFASFDARLVKRAAKQWPHASVLVP